MLKRKLGLLVAAAVMVGMFTSCVNVIKNDKGNEGSGDQPSTTQEPEIDYTNYVSGNYSILVKNETSKNVVCFMGAPRAENLISGAKAATTTGLKLDTGLFNKSTDFVLFVVSEEDYLANKNNLKELDNRPLARLYAYYNKDSTNNKMVYTISSKLGGVYKLYLNNMTQYNIELRKDGLFGEALAYSASKTLKTTIGVDEGQYDLFPVFRKFDSSSGEIITNYPKTSSGNPQICNFSLDSSSQEYEIDAGDYIGEGFKITPSQAQLKIDNQSKAGVALYEGAGSTPTMTSTGGVYINPGKALYYSVNMDALGNGTYESFRTISGWRVGPTQKKYDIPEIKFEAGYRYIVKVTGESWDELTVVVETEGEGENEVPVKYELNFDN